APAIVEVVDAIRRVITRHRRPEGYPRRHRPLKHIVAKRPDARTGRIERRLAPTVDDEFDILPRRALDWFFVAGIERLEIAALALPRNERQIAIVVHRSNHDRPELTATVADASRRAQDVPIVRAER